MIPDVHLQRSLHLIKSGPDLHTSSGLGATWSTTKEAFVILIRYSDFLEDEADVYTREKSLAASSRAFIHTATKECSRVIHFTPQQIGDLQKGQLPESYVPQ